MKKLYVYLFAWQKLMKCYMFAPKARWQICCIYIACCWAAPAIYQMLNNIKETSKELRTGQLTMNHSLLMLFWLVLKSGSSTSTLGAEVVFFPQRFDRYCSIEQVSLSARLHVNCFKGDNRIYKYGRINLQAIFVILLWFSSLWLHTGIETHLN